MFRHYSYGYIMSMTGTIIHKKSICMKEIKFTFSLIKN